MCCYNYCYFSLIHIIPVTVANPRSLSLISSPYDLCKLCRFCAIYQLLYQSDGHVPCVVLLSVWAFFTLFNP